MKFEIGKSYQTRLATAEMVAVFTYTVTFTPNETTPAGELGKPDFYGFKVEAVTGRDALEIARARFDRAFPHLAAHYTGILETT